MELKIIPVIQVIIAVLFMVTLANLLPELSYHWQLSQVLSLILFLSACVIGILAVFCFRQARTTVNPTQPEKSSAIVDSGIYRYSRNPMYVALLLVVITVAVYLQNIAGFLVIPFFILYITRYQIIPEERMLVTLFGDDFTHYYKKVRRWI